MHCNSAFEGDAVFKTEIGLRLPTAERRAGIVAPVGSRREAQMRRGHFVLRTVAVAAFVVMIATGCSMIGPESAWDGNNGTVTGTVNNRMGTPIEAMTVQMWAEVGSDAREVTYEVTSGADGTFELSDIDLGDPHSFAQVYEVYVNRMKDTDVSLNEEYVSYYGSVTVTKDSDCVVAVVLDLVDTDPGDPESMFE